MYLIFPVIVIMLSAMFIMKLCTELKVNCASITNVIVIYDYDYAGPPGLATFTLVPLSLYALLSVNE